MREVIPVVHCFDRRFTLPAAVAFSSMLEHASAEFDYRLYVIQSDIPSDERDRLQRVVEARENATLTFIDAPAWPQRLFEAASHKGHYSKEMFLKFAIPELLPQHERAIVTDVDVVWRAGIDLVWREAENLDGAYLAGVRPIMPRGDSWLRSYWTKYERDFSAEEIGRLITGAGLWVFDLDQMRRDALPERFVEFALQNAERLRQPEQDVVNLVCFPRIKLLSLKNMVPAYVVDQYGTDPGLAIGDEFYDTNEIREALERPVQFHFTGPRKPWTNPGVSGAKYWFEALARTDHLQDWLATAAERFSASPSAGRISVPVPFGRGGRLSIQIERG